MKRTCLIAVALASLSWPAQAVTIANGVVLFSHADAINGNVTPGDTPGYPVTISVAGSYRLASNLAPPAGQVGINVTAAEVTIDFFGFRMAGSGTAARGVVGNARALTVMNGTIRGFQTAGIYTAGGQFQAINMRISDSSFGIFEFTATAGGATIKDSEFFNNATYGVSCTTHCSLEGNNFDRNGNGIYVVSGMVLANNISGSNVGVDSGGLYVGVGNNALFDNTTSIKGSYRTLYPNACSPACIAPLP